MAEVRSAGNFANRPLYVLSSSTPFPSPGPQYAQATEALNEYWFHELQPRLAALSTRGHLTVEENAEQTHATVEAVRDVVADVRADSRSSH
jgi:hypothetical protein